MRLLLLVLLFSPFITFANYPDFYTSHGNYNIRSNDVLWHRTVWRHMDLQLSANTPYLGCENNLPQILISAVRRGSIKAYNSDSLKPVNILNWKALNDRLTIFTDAEAANTIRLTPFDLQELELREDLVFDSRHSRMYVDITAISLYLPADHPINPYGFRVHIATFSTKELYATLFKEHYWVGPNNLKSRITYEAAFKARYFDAPIVKVNNYDNSYYTDYISDPQKIRAYSDEIENKIRSFEYDLWIPGAN